jgi:hypothetical protein
MSNPVKTIYKVTFVNYGTIYEIYARQIAQSNLFGLIEVEELIFGEKSSLVVDPGEERLKNEFNGVKRSFLPMHTILRIDEVVKEGVAKIRDASDKLSNVSPFPSPFYNPPKER